MKSLVKDMQNKNLAIDNLIAIDDDLEWIPCSQVTEIKSSQVDNIYYVIRKKTCDWWMSLLKYTRSQHANTIMG